MPRSHDQPAAPPPQPPPLPLPPDLWHRVAAAMGLSGQHASVVEHVLRGMSDKQIMTALNIRRSTLRTYFDRIAYHTGLSGRPALFRHVMTLSLRLASPGVPPKSDGQATVV